MKAVLSLEKELDLITIEKRVKRRLERKEFLLLTEVSLKRILIG